MAETNMLRFELIAPCDYKSMPWKNGLGETTELSSKTDAITRELIWRLSIACVTEDGNFSDFSGFQRTLILISGSGLVLSHQGQVSQTLKNQYEMCTFDGAWNTSAKLLDGSIKDFNVICDATKAYATVSVTVVGESKEIDSHASDIFIFAHKSKGIVRCSHLSDITELEIPKGHLLHTFNNETTHLEVSGKGLICVEIYKQ